MLWLVRLFNLKNAEFYSHPSLYCWQATGPPGVMMESALMSCVCDAIVHQLQIYPGFKGLMVKTPPTARPPDSCVKACLPACRQHLHLCMFTGVHL